MSKKRLIQTLSLFFLAAGLIFIFPATDWSQHNSLLGFFSVLLGTIGSAISLFIPSSYVYQFSVHDWRQDLTHSNFNLIIPHKKHGLGKSPKVQVFEIENGNFQEVGVDVQHDAAGNVMIGANMTFSGKAILN